MCLEVTTATQLDTVFSGKQPLKIYYNIQRFGDELRLRHHGDGISHRLDVGNGVSLRNVGFYNPSHVTA
jgi:hypothetical protein